MPNFLFSFFFFFFFFIPDRSYSSVHTVNKVFVLAKIMLRFKQLCQILFSVTLRPNMGHGLRILEVSRSHTTHNSRYDSSGRVISSSQRPPPDNTQHSQQRNIRAPGRIRKHNLSSRAAADPWDWPIGDSFKFYPLD